MTKRKDIYAIQEQGSLGCWEVTGHAFTDKAQADAYVDKKTIESIIESLDYGPHRGMLAEWAKVSVEKVEAMEEGALVELIKSLPDGYLTDLAGEMQCGGFFSYEVLQIYDGEDPE